MADDFEQMDDDGDWEEGERCGPRHERRASQLISFAQDDLDAIRAAAQRAGLSTSDYIRDAALDRLAKERTAAPRA